MTRHQTLRLAGPLLCTSATTRSAESGYDKPAGTVSGEETLILPKCYESSVRPKTKKLRKIQINTANARAHVVGVGVATASARASQVLLEDGHLQRELIRGGVEAVVLRIQLRQAVQYLEHTHTQAQNLTDSPIAPMNHGRTTRVGSTV